jgi:hypothetical protein
MEGGKARRAILGLTMGQGSTRCVAMGLKGAGLLARGSRAEVRCG